MTDRRLVRHLKLAVVLKVAVLLALWWAFVRDARVPVDAEAARLHLSPAPLPAAPPFIAPTPATTGGARP